MYYNRRYSQVQLTDTSTHMKCLIDFILLILFPFYNKNEKTKHFSTVSTLVLHRHLPLLSMYSIKGLYLVVQLISGH